VRSRPKDVQERFHYNAATADLLVYA
jgi:hypothetical protein